MTSGSPSLARVNRCRLKSSVSVLFSTLFQHNEQTLRVLLIQLPNIGVLHYHNNLFLFSSTVFFSLVTKLGFRFVIRQADEETNYIKTCNFYKFLWQRQRDVVVSFMSGKGGREKQFPFELMDEVKLKETIFSVTLPTLHGCPSYIWRNHSVGNIRTYTELHCELDESRSCGIFQGSWNLFLLFA